MELMDKLEVLTDAAKYDAACTSSGLDRKARQGRMGSTMAPGCCHTFSADGRCVTLLKVLLTNCCVYDCQYCVNRRSPPPPLPRLPPLPPRRPQSPSRPSLRCSLRAMSPMPSS